MATDAAVAREARVHDTFVGGHLKSELTPADNLIDDAILQALIELAESDSGERSVLEALSNRAADRGGLGYHQKELLTS